MIRVLFGETFLSGLIMKLVKLIIFGVILSLTISSCNSADKTNTYKMESVENSDYLEVQPLSYKGHQYLWFRAKIRKGFGGITYDPDCSCYE